MSQGTVNAGQAQAGGTVAEPAGRGRRATGDPAGPPGGPAGDRGDLPAGRHQRAVHPVRREHHDLRGRRGGLEPVLRLLRLHRARQRGVLRHRRLHRGPAGQPLEAPGRGHLRAAAAGRPGRRADRGAARADRAAGPAAHVRRDHDRVLLHLPADGVQPQLHRREPGRELAVLPVVRVRLQQPLLLRRPDHRGGHHRAVLADPELAVRPPAAGHPGRRGPGPRPGRADHEDQAHRVRDLGRDHRHDRRPVVVLHRAGAARDRVQPAVRPDRRADGLPGRVRHAGRPGARRADPGAAPAVDRDHLHQRLHQRHRARRAVPGRHPVPAARDRPDRGRVRHQVARHPGPAARARRRADRHRAEPPRRGVPR